MDNSGDVGRHVSITLDSEDNPRVSYCKGEFTTDLDLKYAYHDIGWHIDTVDSYGIVGGQNIQLPWIARIILISVTRITTTGILSTHTESRPMMPLLKRTAIPRALT